MQKPSFLKTKRGDQLAYHKSKMDKKSSATGIIFLGGLMSDMQGTKALALEAFCHEHNYDFIRFDYIGHGESSGTFTEGTIGRWKENAIEILDNLTEGKQLLVGSSLGGWLMLLVTLARPERVAGLIGIASAPDFTEKLMWDQFDETVRKELTEKGIYQMPSEYSNCPYPVTRELIEEGRNHLLLNKPINITCPIRLLHGMKDDDVPYSFSTELTEKIISEDIETTFIKRGDHRMSDPYILQHLYNTVKEMLAVCDQN